MTLKSHGKILLSFRLTITTFTERSSIQIKIILYPTKNITARILDSVSQEKIIQIMTTAYWYGHYHSRYATPLVVNEYHHICGNNYIFILIPMTT